MNPPQDDDAAGYRRPPKQTRWKKGQSGNPNRRYPARSKSTVEMIDRLFLKPVTITENGEEKKVSTLEAIFMQLWHKEIAGDRRASDVRLKYETFARANSEIKVEMIFIDNAYTRALANGLPTGSTGDD
jgi:Family of unknown function (DUF5681)